MQSNNFVILSTRRKLPFAFLALIGVVLVLLSTSRYGAGISNDSVGYISAARNLTAGVGVVIYTGRPLVEQPPLYPGLLALINLAVGTDPILFAHIVNALIFGLIVWLSGLLALRYFTSYTLALLGVVAVLVSRPLFRVSVLALSETLFICFILVTFICVNLYLSRRDATSLVLLSFSVALAALTRYMGIILIPWAVLVLVVFRGANIRTKIIHSFFFIFISVLPVSMWIIRNHTVSGTFLGPRASSVFSLSHNLRVAFDTFALWYIPERFVRSRLVLMFLGAVVGYVGGVYSKANFQRLKPNITQIGPVILFIVVYMAFLIVSSTTVAYDQIGDRLLSPIYTSSLLRLLYFVDNLLDSLKGSSWYKIISICFLIVISVWLLYTARLVALDARHRIIYGAGGYNRKVWRESATIQYLQEHRSIQDGCALYSNSPNPIYIFANLRGKLSPPKTKYNSNEIANRASTLKGRWPREGRACLIWFNFEERKQLFTVNELQTVADLKQIVQLSDGAIYSVSRK